MGTFHKIMADGERSLLYEGMVTFEADKVRCAGFRKWDGIDWFMYMLVYDVTQANILELQSEKCRDFFLMATSFSVR